MIKNLDTFISGDKIDLKVPTIKFAKNSNWYQLINSKKNNRYLDHGVFPNTKDDQVNFLKNSKKEGRLVLIVSDKSNNFIGVVNLSNINLEKKSAEIALIINLDKKISHVSNNILNSLESISLVTTHAFDNLNINRITAGQSISLYKWHNLMELLGYKIEGINKKKIFKNNNFTDAIIISCLREDYEFLKKRRGVLWDSSKSMLLRIKKLPKETAFYKVRKSFEEIHENYYKYIFNL